MRDTARGIMDAFLARTGLGRSDRPPTRYLWTDAFAVCNLLGLHLEEADPGALENALRLVDETHRVLGRHRPDDARRGWISGLDEEAGARHPTLGGLRIGKRLPERKPGEAFDPALEWDRDGQYFHYLTKWMIALDRVSDVSSRPEPRRWAVEMAQSAHERFCVRDSGGRPIGLHWKMSIDLQRPLVPSMGQHDPLDGFLVLSRLRAPLAPRERESLSDEIQSLRRMCIGRDWSTDDTLGIGGLLTDAYSLARMMGEAVLDEPNLLRDLLVASLAGVETVMRRRMLDGPARLRLPFRELGMAIGLRAIERLGSTIDEIPGSFTSTAGVDPILESFERHVGLASRIEQFWLDPAHRKAPTWVDHMDINEVMLATSLAPGGFLGG